MITVFSRPLHISQHPRQCHLRQACLGRLRAIILSWSIWPWRSRIRFWRRNLDHDPPGYHRDTIQIAPCGQPCAQRGIHSQADPCFLCRKALSPASADISAPSFSICLSKMLYLTLVDDERRVHPLQQCCCPPVCAASVICASHSALPEQSACASAPIVSLKGEYRDPYGGCKKIST